MKISVVIPAYNYAHFLPECIDSVLKQTLKPHEVIVVDDGSKDNTRDVVGRYPVTYVYQTNSGLSAARNRGIREATGDWVALLDADDVWLPEKLERQAAAIKDEGFCYCATTRFYPDGHLEDAEFFDGPEGMKQLRHHNFIDPSGVIIRRDLLLEVGGFNEKMPAGEDWEMWLRMARRCKFVGVPERLLRYRVTGTSMSSKPEIFLKSIDDIVAAGTEGMPPLRRMIEGQRMRCVRYLQVAIKYRDKQDYRNSLLCALKAFAAWPSPFYDKTARVVFRELRNFLFA